ncbi:hypothetical protein M885DRAFT_573960 [Pelagophyceae sp. CCMP2097]|nr:hypothetical protein M885DRAFT_573960 [Pelagophyceae sp. CCMP2097]
MVGNLPVVAQASKRSPARSSSSASPTIKKTQDGQLTVLRVTRAAGLALHLMYIRKSGPNKGVREFKDQVTVVSGGEGQYSNVLAALSSGRTFTVPAFDGGFDLIIAVCEMGFSPSKKGKYAPYAAISVHLADGTQTSQCAMPSVPECKAKREACGDDPECCSGRYKGKLGGEKTCRAGKRGAR